VTPPMQIARELKRDLTTLPMRKRDIEKLPIRERSDAYMDRTSFGLAWTVVFCGLSFIAQTINLIGHF
jgi:hypothetical protein